MGSRKDCKMQEEAQGFNFRPLVSDDSLLLRTEGRGPYQVVMEATGTKRGEKARAKDKQEKIGIVTIV